MRSLPAKRVLTAAALVLATAAAATAPDIVEGNPSAPVRVLIFSDLQCDYCQNFRTLLDEKLLPKYGKDVAFVHRDFPLPRHTWARQAAMAARWVWEQNPHAGVVFRRELLSEQEHITPDSLKSWLIEFADRNKLSEQAIVAATTDPRLGALVDSDIQAGTVRGIKNLPTVIVAGKTFSGTIIYDEIAQALDQALPH
ncbi:MAG TPA: thioredoxin domain-containing protein [Bryobacteraceae bacterium]|nr:thioredoxin domain-containing protein [Bryobacteraceae bacterium]